MHDLNVSLVVGIEVWLGRIFLPVTCKTGELSAYTWLAITLAIPPVCSLIIIILGYGARASILSATRSASINVEPKADDSAPAHDAGEGDTTALRGGRQACDARSLSPALYTCHTWVFLLLYPSLSRATLSTFMCEELGGKYYLKEDTRQVCFDNSSWQAWASLAGVGLLVYSIGAPLAAFLLTRQWRMADSERRRQLGQRLELLLASYTEDCW